MVCAIIVSEQRCIGAAKSGTKSSFNTAKAEKNEVDEGDFPSLKQAFNMARGIKPKAKAKPQANSTRPKSSQPMNGTVGGAPDNDAVSESAAGLEPDSDEEDPEIIRSAYESSPPPPAMEPLLQPLDSGELPGNVTVAEVFTRLILF